MAAGLVEGKVALVTGAASGIGRATAVAFAREGAAAVVVADIDADGGEGTAAMVRDEGAEATFVAVDVTDGAQVAAMVAGAIERHGQLDCAHNNAGTTGPMASVAELAEAEWARVLALNLTSVFLCMKHELAHMVPRGSGAIVNTSSGAGLVGFPGLPAYVASKHGVLGLTKSAAIENAAAGVRVNAVCPGSTRTPMLEGFIAGDAGIERMLTRTSPTGRLGQADEVAEAVVWLCSDRASFVNGHTLVVDGGAVSR